jgi:capsid protein
MPFNVAAGNSSGYNYASGRLDHQTYYKSIRIDQDQTGLVALDPILGAWLVEASLIDGYLPAALARQLRQIGRLSPALPARALPDHQWFWDGQEHVDPLKEANAQATRLANHTTTLAAEFARQGKDWETELRQRAKERQLMQELRLVDEAPLASVPATDDE